MRTVVIYKSKTGFAEKYAKWIAEDLHADIIDASAAKVEQLQGYDTIIFGGSLYAVGINGVKLITSNLEQLRGKKIVVFATGVAPLYEEGFNEVKNSNFSPEQQKEIEFFYFRGGFNYQSLKAFDKLLITLLKWKILLKKRMGKPLIADEIGMLTVLKKPADYTKRANLAPLYEYVQKET